MIYTAESGGKRSSGGGNSGGSSVVELTEANFNALVMDSTEHWLVEFYAPWYVSLYLRDGYGMINRWIVRQIDKYGQMTKYTVTHTHTHTHTNIRTDKETNRD